MHAKLTASFCKNVESNGTDQFFRDTELRGFSLRVRASGAKSFYAEGRVGGGRAAAKRSKTWAYGPFTVDQARREAGAFIRALAGGIDPLAVAAEAAAELEAARKAEERHFAKVAEDYIAKVLPRLDSADAKASIIRRRFVSVWGDRDIASIRHEDVQAVVYDIEEQGFPSAAWAAVRAIRPMFGWAKRKGYVTTNPAEGARPDQDEFARERTLSDSELAEVWRVAQSVGWPWGPFVQLLALTAQRRDEVAAMRWSELDLEGGIWSIPASRKKEERPHIVHLSALAIRIIKAIPKTSDQFVLSTTGRSAISGYSKAKARLDSEIIKARTKAAEAAGLEGKEVQGMKDWGFHDLRRTAVTGMAALGHAPHIVDRVQAHAPAGVSKVAAIYNKFEYLPERKAALLGWSRHVEAILAGKAKSNVVELSKGKRKISQQSTQ